MISPMPCTGDAAAAATGETAGETGDTAPAGALRFGPSLVGVGTVGLAVDIALGLAGGAPPAWGKVGDPTN